MMVSSWSISFPPQEHLVKLCQQRATERRITGKSFLSLFAFACSGCSAHACVEMSTGVPSPPRVPSPSATWSPTQSPVTTSSDLPHTDTPSPPGSLIPLPLPTSLCLPAPWTITSKASWYQHWFQDKCHLPGGGLPSPYFSSPTHLGSPVPGLFSPAGHCGPALDETTLQICLPPSGLQPHLLPPGRHISLRKASPAHVCPSLGTSFPQPWITL